MAGMVVYYESSGRRPGLRIQAAIEGVRSPADFMRRVVNYEEKNLTGFICMCNGISDSGLRFERYSKWKYDGSGGNGDEENAASGQA